MQLKRQTYRSLLYLLVLAGLVQGVTSLFSHSTHLQGHKTNLVGEFQKNLSQLSSHSSTPLHSPIKPQGLLGEETEEDNDETSGKKRRVGFSQSSEPHRKNAAVYEVSDARAKLLNKEKIRVKEHKARIVFQVFRL